MKKTIYALLLIALVITIFFLGKKSATGNNSTQEFISTSQYTMTPMEVYQEMTFLLNDKWSLSPKEAQVDTTGAHKNPAIAHLVGTDAIGSEYKIIGRGATFEELLLPNTMKKMVTMYHCNSFTNCTQMKATHYCAKKNQPEFLLNLKETTKEKFVFDCDMSTKLCNSNEDHIHKIILEISEEGDHLKASYLAWKNKKLRKHHSIYHFDRL